MTDPVFYAEDPEGALRRWIPTPEMMRGNEMARAIRGGTAMNDTPTLIEFLADRLVEVYGENARVDFILAAKERAAMLRRSLPESAPAHDMRADTPALTRGQQRHVADYLDEIADEKLIGYPLGRTDPMTANRLSLAAAYRLVATDMRALSDGESSGSDT